MPDGKDAIDEVAEELIKDDEALFGRRDEEFWQRFIELRAQGLGTESGALPPGMPSATPFLDQYRQAPPVEQPPLISEVEPELPWYKKALGYGLGALGKAEEARRAYVEPVAGIPLQTIYEAEFAPRLEPSPEQEIVLRKIQERTITRIYPARERLAKRAMEKGFITESELEILRPYYEQIRLPVGKEQILERYRETEYPWGVKGGAELTAELVAWGGVGWALGPLATAAGMASAISKIPIVGRFLARGLWPAVKGEELVGRAIAYPIKKISQRRLESQIYKLFQKLPTENELAVILTEDWYRSAAKSLSKVPGMKAVIRRINPSGVADSQTERAIMRHLALLETTDNKGNAIMALLQRYGDDVALFNVTAEGLCRGIVLKPKFTGKIPLKGGMPALGDVLEYPNYFVLTKAQQSYIKELWKLNDIVKAMLRAEGISVNEISFKEGTHWVHRVVIGKYGERGVELLRQGSFRPGARKVFEQTRYHQYMIEGIENKVVYGQSANQYFRTYYTGAMKMIADKRLANAVSGATALERMPLALRQEAVNNALKVRNYTRLTDRLRKIKAEWKAPEVTLKAVDRWDATTGSVLRAILADTTKTATGKRQAVASLIKRAEQKLNLAKQENWISRARYKKAKEWAMKPHEGEAYINMPFARGKIYPRETADAIMKYYGDVPSKFLRAMNNMSSASRTAVATFDFSAPFIQGLPVLGHSPHKWAEATGRMFYTFFNKKTHTNFMVKHNVTLQEMAQNRCVVFGTEGMHEMVEAIPLIGKNIGKIPLLGKTLQRVFQETYGRFGYAFSSWGDTTRILLWESMRDGWARRGALDELARLINHMTGVVSTKALGITSSQRAFESGFIWFAPRYTRAGIALFGDILKGGYTTGHAIRAIGGFLAGGTSFYVGACAATGQVPNLDPSSARFMTLKVGNQYIGIGGFITSAVRFATDVTRSAASLGEDEPLDFIKLDRYKNPMIRGMFSKAAPMTGLIVGLATRKDYLGRSLEDVGDYSRFLADKVIPIAMQTITTQEKKANWQAFLAEMLGGRTFPESLWEEVRKVRDEAAGEDYGMNYEELDIHDKRMLEQNHPEIKQMIGEAEAEWAKWYPDDPRVKYSAEMDDSDALYSDQLWVSVRELQIYGAKTTGEFIDKADDFGLRHAERNNEIRKDYPEVLEQFERWHERDKNDWLLFDLAYDEYIQNIVVPSWEDEFYNFKFAEYQAAQQGFKAKWGEGVYREVREAMWLGDDMPPLFLELKASREQWRSYYEMPEGEARQVWRQTHPDIEAYLFFWGRVTTFENPESSRLVLALMEKYDIPFTAIKGFKDNLGKYRQAELYHKGMLKAKDADKLLSPRALKLIGQGRGTLPSVTPSPKVAEEPYAPSGERDEEFWRRFIELGG